MHLISGWGYPVSALTPLRKALLPRFDVEIHPFTTDPAALVPPREPWWLAGWSLGGMKAMQAIADETLRPEGLLLIASTARFCANTDYDCGVEHIILRQMMSRMLRHREKVLARFFELAGMVTHSDFTDEELMRGLKFLDEMDLRDALTNIDLPVLLVHGTHDHIIPVEASIYLRDHLPDARLLIHEGAGHDLPAREYAWLAKQLNDQFT
jgi:pimeloyl-[acyl-carrier protein] methyl ester esterase